MLRLTAVPVACCEAAGVAQGTGRSSAGNQLTWFTWQVPAPTRQRAGTCADDRAWRLSVSFADAERVLPVPQAANGRWWCALVSYARGH